MTRTRKAMTLTDAAREFWRHPSPWWLAIGFVASVLIARAERRRTIEIAAAARQ